MIINAEIDASLKIENLFDLHKLKQFMEVNNMKVNKSQIARELDVDVRTVGKYIEGFKKSTTRARESKIDEYYDLIKELLSEESIQIFYYKRVLWQYLKDNYGLDCAQSSFRRYISKHKEFDIYFKKSKSNISNETSMRFESSIGEQAQLDWKENMEFTLEDGEVIKINVFVLILSYSRFRVYRLSLSKKQDVLFSFMNDAFETFGGVPKEILTDNMKTVMDKPRTQYSKGTINNKFEQFASDYNFKVSPCIAGRPNTKAKVEAPMKLLDEILAYNGKLSYDQLNALVDRLNNRKNNEFHPSTGKIPILHLDNEKDFLNELPREQIRNLHKIKTQRVKVNKQSMITYKQNQYSVPPKYIGLTLQLQVYDNLIHIYCTTKLVTIHNINSRKLNYHEQHYVEIASLTFNDARVDIEKMAKSNLQKIGAIYNNE